MEYTTADVSPYQYGLMLQLPKTFDRLAWKRNGEFTTCPTDHIGKNEGSAMLNARHMADVEEHNVEPKGNWKDDANDLGRNDFRSTKQFIKKASLQD